MTVNPERASLALALVGGDPDKLHPQYSAGYMAGYHAGIEVAVAVMFRRKPRGARKKAADKRAWNDARLISLMVDIVGLRARGHTDMASCKILTSKAMYRDRYGGMSPNTLRRRLADARKVVK